MSDVIAASRARRPDRLGERDRQVFLDALAGGATLSAAAKAAGFGKETFRRHRLADPEFAKAWEDAYEEGTDVLEAEAQRRAVEGVEEPVTVAGQREVVRKYSDTLLIFLLKGRRPTKFARFEVDRDGAARLTVSAKGVSLDDVVRVAREAGVQLPEANA